MYSLSGFSLPFRFYFYFSFILFLNVFVFNTHPFSLFHPIFFSFSLHFFLLLLFFSLRVLFITTLRFWYQKCSIFSFSSAFIFVLRCRRFSVIHLHPNRNTAGIFFAVDLSYFKSISLALSLSFSLFPSLNVTFIFLLPCSLNLALILALPLAISLSLALTLSIPSSILLLSLCFPRCIKLIVPPSQTRTRGSWKRR